jgi:heat-inducible transcriptional repressor
MADDLGNLNDRAREVFRIVVENYLENGQPVGSRTISRRGTLELSPASIRNVMQDLEELGLLAAPHTSAGRMPTETGLRLFVDGMMQVAEPSEVERATIERELGRGGSLEMALAATTNALSGLSSCAGMVMVPKRDIIVRQFSFVRLSPDQALAVIVGTDGNVENRVIDLPPGTTESMLLEASNFMSSRFGGTSLSDAIRRLRTELEDNRSVLQKLTGELITKGLAEWTTDHADRPILIVRGQAHLIDANAGADLERVRSLLDELEEREEIVRLLDSARDAQSTKIFIGAENKLFSLSGSSVVAAPYRDREGRVLGVVGVIGPTRLNYGRIVPMVDFTARGLTRLMENSGTF